MNNINNHSDKITRLTPELMEQYAQGKLPPDKMHAVEKYLLDNPFEAEAIEGVSSYSDNLLKDVQTLQSNIQDRVKENSKKTIPIWRRYYGIAAAIALIVVGSIVIMNLFENKSVEKDQLALEDNFEVEESTPVLKEKVNEESTSTEKEEIILNDENVIVDNDNNSDNKKILSESEESKQKTESIQRYKKELKPIEQKYSYNKEVEDTESKMEISEKIKNEAMLAQADEIETPKELESNRNELVLAEEAEIPNLEEELDVAKSLSGKVAGVQIKKRKAKDTRQPKKSARAENFEVTEVDSNRRKVSGTITSIEDGMPIPGVNVVIKGSTTGTISDFDGNYEIITNEGDVLVYSFIGLVSEEIKESGEAEINLAMAADVAQLSEVVVTGYATSNQNQELAPSKSARPIDGFNTYRKYLKEKLIYPQQALDSAIEGKVTIEFIVTASGVLKDFKIKKGIGYGCDEEAIRLIKEGSRWEAAEENGISVEKKMQIKVKFDLD